MAIDKLVDSAQLESDLTSVADAIRAKTGGSADLQFPADFVSEIGSISGGLSIDDVVTHNFVGDITCTASGGIWPLAFQNATGLTGFSAPNITIVEGSSNHGYGANIDTRIFQGCTNLESVSLPKVTSFYYAGWMFDGCKKITNWDLAFDDITSLGGYVFYNSSFPSAVFKSLVVERPIYQYCFANCAQIKYMDINTCNHVANYAFNNSPTFDTFIIRRTDEVPKLNNANAFNGTRFASGGTGGTFYVPSALVSSYESATNWSTVISRTNNQILPIEGSIYETQYADGTPIA